MSQGHKFSRFVHFIPLLSIHPKHLTPCIQRKHIFVFVKDANAIKKVFAQRRTEIEQAEPTKSSLRIRYFFFSSTGCFENASFSL